MAVQAGTYKARVTGECVLGTSKNKGTPFVEFYLEILSSAAAGSRVKWQGYFTENTNERSIQSLQICGWQGDDLSEFSDGGLHGLDANEVEIVVELEEYTNAEGEDKVSAKVAWINRQGGFLNTEAAMNEGAAAAFGSRMRGLVLKMKEKNPAPVASTKSAPKPQARTAAPAPQADLPEDEIPF
jgi:hypothetical protein